MVLSAFFFFFSPNCLCGVITQEIAITCVAMGEEQG